MSKNLENQGQMFKKKQNKQTKKYICIFPHKGPIKNAIKLSACILKEKQIVSMEISMLTIYDYEKMYKEGI